jgi:hypothetical protein
MSEWKNEEREVEAFKAKSLSGRSRVDHTLRLFPMIDEFVHLAFSFVNA